MVLCGAQQLGTVQTAGTLYFVLLNSFPFADTVENKYVFIALQAYDPKSESIIFEMFFYVESSLALKEKQVTS